MKNNTKQRMENEETHVKINNNNLPFSAFEIIYRIGELKAHSHGIELMCLHFAQFRGKN